MEVGQSFAAHLLSDLLFQVRFEPASDSLNLFGSELAAHNLGDLFGLVLAQLFNILPQQVHLFFALHAPLHFPNHESLRLAHFDEGLVDLRLQIVLNVCQLLDLLVAGRFARPVRLLLPYHVFFAGLHHAERVVKCL